MANEIAKQSLSMLQNKAVTGNEVKPMKPVGVQDVSAPAAQSSEQNKDQPKIEAIVENTAERLNEVAQSIQRELQFSVDKESGDTIIRVLDTETMEVIRQIPSEEVMALRENIESMKGILFSAEV